MSINSEYLKEIKLNDTYYSKEFKNITKKISNSTAIYNGIPVDTLLMPKFFSKNQIETFENLTHTMMNIIDKITKQYIDNEQYRVLFPFSKSLEEMILADHGYSNLLPIARIDFFYNESNGNFKFCEFNTDGTSAMNEDRELVRIFSDSNIFKKITKKYNLFSFELIDSWIDELMKIYKNSKFNKENPTVAIIDFLDKATLDEFKVFKEYLEKRGYKTLIVDIRDVEFDGKVLSHDGHIIDLVYRRAVTTEINRSYSDISQFINACSSGKVCIVGPIKTQIAHNKMIFKILHDEETLSFLDNEEKIFIEEHIPYTEILTRKIIEEKDIIKNKDEWIIKPIDLYGSKGVYAGLDLDEYNWDKIIDECVNKDYLLQEYCDPYMSEFPVFYGDKLKIEKFRNITGVYMYRGKMKGILSRAGQKAVVSGLNKGVTIPTFVYK